MPASACNNTLCIINGMCLVFHDVNDNIFKLLLQASALYTILLFMTEVSADTTHTQTPYVADRDYDDMLKAGVHLGHSKSKNHPSMQPYIFAVRNTVSIIDLTKTKEKLTAALAFIKNIVEKGGTILLIGTRPSSRHIIAEVAREVGMPYSIERWIGGTLTNFKIISKRVEYMEDLEQQEVKGEFDKYTKKERSKKIEEKDKLKKMFEGLRLLKKLPDALFVVNTIEDDLALREAKRMNIPIVALIDTNADFNSVEWSIPSNDDALPAVRYMVRKVADAIKEGQATIKNLPSV